MALLFCDSFDHYTTLAMKSWSNLGNSVIVSGGRFSSNCLRITQSGEAQRAIPAASTYVIGFAYQTTALPPTEGLIMQLLDTGTGHVGLYLTSAGKLRVKRGTTQIGSDGTTLLSASTWYYLEFKVFLDDSTGTLTTRINGQNEHVLTSQDTKNTANAFATHLSFYTTSFNSGNQTFRDDFYLLDGSGSAPMNDFLGDVRVEMKLPNANGNSSGFVGSDGNSTDNYLLVDETAPNDDTDYVVASANGTKDTYGYPDLDETSGTVFGVQIVPDFRKADPGVGKLATVARLSATEEDSANKTATDSYLMQPDFRPTKPGGGAWTIADVNAAEFGVKVTT